MTRNTILQYAILYYNMLYHTITALDAPDSESATIVVRRLQPLGWQTWERGREGERGRGSRGVEGRECRGSRVSRVESVEGPGSAAVGAGAARALGPERAASRTGPTPPPPSGARAASTLGRRGIPVWTILTSFV